MPTQDIPSRPWRSETVLALLLLAALGWLAYLPGLSGGFLFDDLVNLNALGARGPVDNWPAFSRYITSGTADPTGRPLSLLSFLLDARDWPADPAPFLRTNLLLHLLNGALLFALLRRLGAHLDGAGTRTDAAALLGTGLWLLHPLLVSTTLYIVQREAMLPATFILLGLLAWTHGRSLLATRPRAGGAWMLAGIGLGTALAVLCKANGALLPLLAWVLDATVLRAGDGPAATAVARRLRTWRWALLIMPSLLLAGYLLQRMPGLHADLAMRPWTMAERLLTQPRVLLDYLWLLLVPRAVSTGLYNDAYPVSTALLQPVTTLPALLAVAGLVALGLALRRRAPVVAAALLFFFAGHVMESSVVALELYFEHRNYLPAMLLFWPLARALVRWRAPRAWRAALALGLLALLTAITWQRATLWGEPARMAMVWAAQNPDSPRAQATAAMALAADSTPAEAAAFLLPRWHAQPHEPQLAFNYIDSRCAAGGIGTAEAAAVAETLRHTPGAHMLVHRWLRSAIGTAAAQTCPGLTLEVVDDWLQAALANPALTANYRRERDLLPLLGTLALQRDAPDEALLHFKAALANWPSHEFAAALVAQLGAHGHATHGLALLDGHLAGDGKPPHKRGMARLHVRVLERQGYWMHEFSALRVKLLADSEAAGTPTAPAPRTGEAQDTP